MSTSFTGRDCVPDLPLLEIRSLASSPTVINIAKTHDRNHAQSPVTTRTPSMRRHTVDDLECNHEFAQPPTAKDVIDAMTKSLVEVDHLLYERRDEDFRAQLSNILTSCEVTIGLLFHQRLTESEMQDARRVSEKLELMKAVLKTPFSLADVADACKVYTTRRVAPNEPSNVVFDGEDMSVQSHKKDASRCGHSEKKKHECCVAPIYKGNGEADCKKTKSKQLPQKPIKPAKSRVVLEETESRTDPSVTIGLNPNEKVNFQDVFIAAMSEFQMVTSEDVRSSCMKLIGIATEDFVFLTDALMKKENRSFSKILQRLPVIMSKLEGFKVDGSNKKDILINCVRVALSIRHPNENFSKELDTLDDLIDGVITAAKTLGPLLEKGCKTAKKLLCCKS